MAIRATFHGPSATTRAMCRPAAKQRRAIGSGATKQFTQKGTSGGAGPVAAERAHRAQEGVIERRRPRGGKVEPVLDALLEDAVGEVLVHG